MEIEIDRLKELLSYDPLTGNLTWRSTGRGRRKGEIAGSVGSHGYLAVSIDGEKELNHRVIWFYMTGSWPEGEIDHRDRVRLNNRWYNLRDVTPSVNAFNRSSKSSTGFKFVYLKDKGKPYMVTVSQGRRNSTYLGTHETIEEALEVRDVFCKENNIEI